MTKPIGSGLTADNWPRITVENISVNGNTVELYSTIGLFVGQKLFLRKNGAISPEFLIARVWDARFITIKQENGADVTQLDLTQYAGGILDAPEQPRVYPTTTEPGKAIFAEEPILADRNALVSHHGNYLTTQTGNLDIDYPEARFVYDCQYNLREIREFVRDESKGYLGNVRQVNGPDGLAIFTTPLPFMAGNPTSLYYYETLPDGTPTNQVTYDILGFNDYENSYLTSTGPILFNGNTLEFNMPAPEYLIAKNAKYFQPVGTSVNAGVIFQIASYDLEAKFNQTTGVSVNVNSGTGKITFPVMSNVPSWLKVAGHKIKIQNGLNIGLTVTVTGFNQTTREVSVSGLTASETIELKYSIYNKLQITGTFVAGSTTGYLDSRFAFIAVSPTPLTPGTAIANLNGSLGDKVKVTKFSYGCALEVTRIASEYGEVDGEDIYTRDTDPC